jgi:sirohydrochlorin ferrochelatase
MSRAGNLDASPSAEAILLVGHGSRDAASIAQFRATALRVAVLAAPIDVEPAFLEFGEPTIEQAFRALARRGARRIVVTPCLLFLAAHARRDIPAAISAVAADYPHLEIAQSAPLGCHDRLLELSALRFGEALSPHPPVPANETVLVMVGRGSHDAEATAEMQRFVTLRAQRTPVASARAAFVSMAEPRLEAVLDEVASSSARRVVVQPHLLFDGVLSERIAALVERHARRDRQTQWLTTATLGPSDLVCQTLLERAAAARQAMRVPPAGIPRN